MIVGIPSGHEDEFVAYFKERGLNVEEVDING
jgi:D-methionine transport system ATP-binding protein